MGFIVNALGRRVGWCYLWCDVFYSESIYYPEFIHGIYRIRYYLLYFFSHGDFPKFGNFFSHFTIVQLFKKLQVAVYWYDGRWEQDYSDYLFMWTQEIYQINQAKDFENRTHEFFFNCYRIFPFLLYFLKSPTNTWLERRAKSDRDYKDFIDARYSRRVWGDVRKKYRFFKLRKTHLQDLYVPYPTVKLRFFSKELNRFVKKSTVIYRHYRRLVKRVRYPYVAYSQRIYQFFNLPFLKYFFVAINENKIDYWIRFLKSFFLSTHMSLDSLFFQKKILLIFFMYIILSVRVFETTLGGSFKVDNPVFNNLWSNHILRRFFILWGYSPGQRGLLYSIQRKFLSVLFRYMVYWKVDFKQYLISNEEVTAKFLSRYYAIKLQYNYTIREIIRPMKSELSRVVGYTKASGLIWGGYAIKWSLYNKEKSSFRLNLFKKVLSFSLYSYRKLILFFSKVLNFFFSLDMLVVYLWFFKTFKLKEKLISFSIHYFNNRSKLNQFVGFFYSNFKYYFSTLEYLNYSFVSIITPLRTKKSTKIISFYKVIFFMCIEYIFSDYLYKKNDTYFVTNGSMLRAACWHIGRYFKFRYWKDSYSTYREALGVSHLNSRKYLYDKPSNLLGYKVQFRGRFTRRQRSKSVWYMTGRVPIGSVMSNVDFGYFVIPLINSAVSVKVWLHRPKGLMDLYLVMLQ